MSLSLVMEIDFQNPATSPLRWSGRSGQQRVALFREGHCMPSLPSGSNKLLIVTGIHVAKINSELNTSWDLLARILTQNVL